LLGSDSQSLPNPEHGENAKVNKHSGGNKCPRFPPLGESPGGSIYRDG
jgi:hypothetical protein